MSPRSGTMAPSPADEEESGPVREVPSHTVDEQQIAHALENFEKRARTCWTILEYGQLTLSGIHEMRDLILDHVAARTLQDPALEVDVERTLLTTVGDLDLGAVGLGCFPEGDFEIHSSHRLWNSISSEVCRYDPGPEDRAPTAADWVHAFSLGVISGAVWNWRKVYGLLMRDDFAPAIHEGVPYNSRKSHSAAEDLAQMDALSLYLAEAEGPRRAWPEVTLCKPTAEERTEAAHSLDSLAELSPDQRLLRALLDDDQATFEDALVEHLEHYRESVPADSPPRSLLPVGTIALAALAVQLHGWELGVRSPYLPEGLLRTPSGAAGTSPAQTRV